MNATKKVKAKTWIVWAEELNTRSKHTFEVYEFQNGLIMSPNSSCNDEWFAVSSEIEASGNSVITVIESKETEVEFSEKELIDSFLGAGGEWGFGDLPIQKFLELLLVFYEN
jgi:hypothetical protein